MVVAALAFVLATGLLRSAVTGASATIGVSAADALAAEASTADASTAGSYAVVNAHRATLAASEIYMVRAGDTLWSIVSSHFPGIDPRPLVDEMSAAVHGAVLQPGERMVLP